MSDTRIGNSDFTTTIILTGSIEDSLKKAAYLILIIFYGIYFTKQFSQKRQGIQTLQRAGIPVDEHTELISDGIYKYSRNPAFLGFDFMYVGILLMYFNIPLLILSGIAILTLHLQILEEEKYLTSKFNNSYLEYKKHTYRYLGRRK